MHRIYNSFLDETNKYFHMLDLTKLKKITRPHGGNEILTKYLLAGFELLCNRLMEGLVSPMGGIGFSDIKKDFIYHGLQPFLHICLHLFKDKICDYCPTCHGVIKWKGVFECKSNTKTNCCGITEHLVMTQKYVPWIFEGYYTLCPLACTLQMFTSIHHLVVHLLAVHINQDMTCLSHLGLSKHWLEWWLRKSPDIDGRITDWLFQIETVFAEMCKTPIMRGGFDFHKLRDKFYEQW